MSAMRHTFLLQPARWGAVGRLFDSLHRPAEALGELRVSHEPLRWLLDMELAAGGTRWSARRTLSPFAGATAARWNCEHRDLGVLDGSFEFAGKRIFSVFASADGLLRGRETFTRRGERIYAAEGELLRNRRTLSSWDIVLRLL